MNIYFSGLGGVGIGPLAEIAADMGYQVQGSDAAESVMTHKLQDRGINVTIGRDDTFLQACHKTHPIDAFVYTAALPSDHPELILAQQLDIPTMKRDELLARIIAEKNLKLLAVAGTHGKTTTTGMLIWSLQQLGVPVSYSVGTTLSFGPSGKFDPASEYFVYECGEFDRNFLHFKPHLSLVTSVDYDHPDTYPTIEAYVAAFNQFIGQSHHTILWQQAELYLGLNTDSRMWSLQDSELLSLPLAGIHTRQNATLVVKALEYLDIGHGSAKQDAVASFPGTGRRFEKLADNLYSDYGHHPAEIAATLQMARELSDHIVLVYQPHQNIRQHELKGQYTNQFELAEEVYWVPTYLSREDPSLPILTPEELTQNITNKQVVHSTELNDELWNAIEKARRGGKLVLCMGAGSIDNWIRTHL